MAALLTPPGVPALTGVTLDDKYTLERGSAFMSGVQALVRLPLMQRQRDALAGLNTAGFISGYRGSPLGGYDQALLAAQAHLQAHHIVFQPGVNEELAATAVWGTQQLDLHAQARRYDGVFGIWYGKGPGVDRSSDAFKHANNAGVARHGGVLAVAGDDHLSKSSTTAHQSDPIFMACGLPVFYPADVQGILDMGLHAIALSRFAGLWAGMKTVQEVVESSAAVQVDLERLHIVTPAGFEPPPAGLHIRWPDAPLEQESRLMQHKWPAALAYVRANGLNRTVFGSAQDRFGIIASGKAFNDTRQALRDLGLDADTCRAIGLRLHQVNVVWPLEPDTVREFARGLQEVLVVEEKRPIIEPQLKEALYAWPDRPRVVGKTAPGAEPAGQAAERALLPAHGDLSPARVAQAIAERLQGLALPEPVQRRMQAHLQALQARERQLQQLAGADAPQRPPWFCSGCPHNTSTRVPEGSRALAGIGCHYMALWMDRSTSTFSQMGGEGAAWVGQSPFSQEPHVFVNLGDGTYFHSGLLAIRQAIAAGVNITYKILYNDAVAMTGGQRVGERPEGHSVLQIMQSLLAEGVRQLVIVTDDPGKYQGQTLAAGVALHHRDELDAVQRQLRAVPGVSALIYDQMCATEKRRKRKRGTLAEPEQRVIINERVCEGCGDCGEQSNCLSVEPLETELGRKRSINQSSCNKDFSCVKGFCPSFVTVHGGRLRRPAPKRSADRLQGLPALPEPELPPLPGRPGPLASPWGAVVGGIGGTGVITIGQLLGMAAHLEGRAVVTQDAGGLAQKGGATWSHVQIAQDAAQICASKVELGQADLVLACDAIVAASQPTLAVMQPGRTYVALNTHATPTAAFVHQTDWEFPQQRCLSALIDTVGADALGRIDAEHLARQALGDAIYANPVLLGFAWQKGRIPLGRASLLRAMELNAVQVANNQAAFEWGRHAAHDPAAVDALLQAVQVIEWVKKPDQSELVTQRSVFLSAYQNRAYAADYLRRVQEIQRLDALWGAWRLSDAVARQLFRLMAIKDEYEVARLYSDGVFQRQVTAQFEGDYRLQFHLAPPLLAPRGGQGEPVKHRYGPWMMHVFAGLARLRGLRGGPLDVFGYTRERRQERALLADYRQLLQDLAPILARGPQQPRAQALYDLAVQLAGIPDSIKGFGHIKARRLAAARENWDRLRAQWQALLK